MKDNTCFICFDSSGRTGNVPSDSLHRLFPKITHRVQSGNFFYASFTFFLLPSSDKDAVAGSGFCTEPDMSCVCLDEVMK